LEHVAARVLEYGLWATFQRGVQTL